MDLTGPRTKRETAADQSGGSHPGVYACKRQDAAGRTPASAPNEAVDLYEMDADDTFSVERHVAVDSSLGLLPDLDRVDSRREPSRRARGKHP